MALQEEFERTGNWLFRWRSFLPVALAVPLLMALVQFARSGQNQGLSEIWEGLCLLTSLLGAGVRALTVGFVPVHTSGRNTRSQVAGSLNTTGAYSIMRHPIYVGNFLIWLGFVMFLGIWWFVFLFIAMFWLYYERIMYAEEQFLRRQFGEAFVEWSNHVPAFIPNPFLWRNPSMPFSLRTVLRREYTTVFALAVGYAVLDVLEDTVSRGFLHVEAFCAVLACFGATAYMVLRTLKKRTHLLDVSGR